MKPNLVLYHGPHCADGFAAAVVAWEFFDAGRLANFVPVNYGEPVPIIPEGTESIYVLDFSFPREVLLDWCRQRDVVVLDHHKSAEQDLGKLRGTDRLCTRFEREKSGAVMAWEYFRELPDSAIFGEVPALLQYVQDRDLWKWALPYSREVSAGLRLVPRSFTDWAALLWTDERPLLRLLTNDGRVVLQNEAQLVESIVAQAGMVPIGDLMVPVVNTPVLQSECCHRLLELNPNFLMVAAYFDSETTETGLGFDEPSRVRLRRWSLRSRPGFDCSLIAKAYNGGGHPQAAGFEERIGEPGAISFGARPIQGKTRLQALNQELVKREALQEEVRE